MATKKYHFETLQLHVGQEQPDPTTDARAVPIYQTTSYVFRNSQHAADRFGLRDAGNIYGRLTNPTQGVFEDRVAALEGGVAGLAVASGAAAVTYALQNILSQGDHIVAADNLYGGSFNLITHTLATQGITNTIVNVNNLEALEAAIQPNTKVVYAETFGNPNSDVTDIEAIAEVAHRHNIPLIVDNTFGTPYLIRPIEHGADIVVHSATKFIGGHGTSLGGVIVDGGTFDWKANADKFPTLAKPDPSYHGAIFADVAGKAAFVTRIRAVILRDTGATISPFNAFILLQGLETLSLRVERHVENALKVVDYLSKHPKVAKVNHPSLPGHPDHALYQKYFPNGGGSIFTIEIKGGEKEAWKFIDSLRNSKTEKEVSGMISFLLCLAILIVGYFVYGKIVDNTFGPDDRETPAVRINDGVDYVVMPQWKLFLVQLLNIAGLGPIFGAMQGALWGPVVFLWITFGTIFAGGVHDYFSGMMSERNDGASIAEITGKYLGPVMQNVMRVFSVVLLIMVGTVFAVGPAGLIVELCSQSGASGVLTSLLFWLIIILVYYFIATFISIDAVIGKIYPIFGICLIIMAVGVIVGIFTNPAYTIPEIWDHFGSMHPSGTPIWSFMFITVACGAISGFHSTQSPLMARCMKSEKQGHFVFYGAMVCEGVIALIWAAAGCSLYEVTGGLNTGLAEALAMGQSKAIYDVCSKTMGGVGIALAMIGVVVCPITSGDTAFRSARLTLADWFKIDQDSYANRLKLCIPVLGVGAFLGIGNALGFINYIHRAVIIKDAHYAVTTGMA